MPAAPIVICTGIALALVTGILLTRALLFRCVICRKCTWPWQECEPARYSDTMDEVHRVCVTAAHRPAAPNPGKPLTRAASA